MPFQRELDSVIRDVPGALGAVLVDFDGESIIAAANGISTYDLKVVGAYGGIFLDQLRRLTSETGAGSPGVFALDGSGCRILCRSIKDGYYLVLVTGARTPVGLAGERLRACAERLVEEL